MFDPNHENYDKIVAGKAGYLNETFFFIRVAVYFGIWIVLSRYFIKKSLNKTSPAITISPVPPEMVCTRLGIVFTVPNLRCIRLDDVPGPHWYSIYGVYYFAGSFIAIFSVLAILTINLSKNGAEGNRHRRAPA